MTLDEARERIGQKVVYRPRHDWATPDEGVVTSVNNSYVNVFVRFGTQTSSQATLPGDLEPIS